MFTIPEAASVLNVYWLDAPAAFSVEDAPHILGLFRAAYSAVMTLVHDVFGQSFGIFRSPVIRG